MDDINARGLVMIGCGFMGKALLEGWIAAGLSPEAVTVQDPTPSEWLAAQPGFRLNAPLPEAPAVLVIAVKPQVLDEVMPDLAGFGGGRTIVVTIATGAPVSYYERHFGPETPVIRTMPNLPASVGCGVTALCANAAASGEALALVETLFGAVGTSVTLEDEGMMHLVTGVSGSGPAYVFALAEAMAQAGTELGLPKELARALAIQTVAGAGHMLATPGADPTALRQAVTSKGGTTAKALEQLMRTPDGIADLARAAVDASRNRSAELSRS
ncbi:pyrroline-5-carboxylate reductase [Tropicimonas sediminicola]|uniref:Pyrroline-5-carboxylate reductase n=1 Tax=Tropicimonas sediminicola TaxID=1031541 RepID=A0A239HUZ9_9RHOB|nr:pyrroline-5-carboxylate reductase [Tropicimonas sediminicola]